MVGEEKIGNEKKNGIDDEGEKGRNRKEMGGEKKDG